MIKHKFFLVKQEHIRYKAFILLFLFQSGVDQSSSFSQHSGLLHILIFANL